MIVAAGFGEKCGSEPLFYSSPINLEKPGIISAVYAFKGYFSEMVRDKVVVGQDGSPCKIAMVI